MIIKNNERIVCFDPGDTTGIAMMNKESIFHCGTLQWFDMMKFEEFIDGHYLEKYDKWIVEEWRLYPHMAKTMIHSIFIPCQVIGIIRYFANKHDVPLVFQKAADVKRFMTNEKLKQTGLYQTGMTNHVNDAIRHGLYYLITHKEEKAA